MGNCKGDIHLGTACGKCMSCADERAKLPDGYYWALPIGDDPHDDDCWIILQLDRGCFWQMQSDAAVGPWHIKRLGSKIEFTSGG